MSLSISVFGLGYVGSVSAACFASMGHQVIGVDVNPAKVETMESGRSPIIEASMSELAAEGHRAGRLHATIDSTAAVLESDGSFVCVGTPSLRNGKLDLSHIEKVAREIGAALKQKKSGHTIVLRSTVLPGTTESMVLPVIARVIDDAAFEAPRGADDVELILALGFLALRRGQRTGELNSNMPTAGINLLWLLLAVIVDLGGLGGGAHRQSRR